MLVGGGVGGGGLCGGAGDSVDNANSRILGYRQSSSKIDKPCLRMVDKLCLHVSAAACNFRS